MEEKKEIDPQAVEPVQNQETLPVTLGVDQADTPSNLETKPDLVESPASTELAPSPSPKVRRSLLIAGVVVLFLALAGGGYFLWQNSKKQISAPSSSETSVKDETADWKSYENTKYGYSFKYPENLISPFENAGSEGHIKPPRETAEIVILNQTSDNVKDNFNTWIQTRKFPQGEDLAEYVKELHKFKDGFTEFGYEDAGGIFREKVLAFESLLVDGKKAIKIVAQVLPNQGSVEDINYSAYILYKEDVIIHFDDSHGLYHDLKINDQILSTFKFLDDNVSELKEYKNTTYGYSISLPENWKAYEVTASGNNSDATNMSLVVDISDTTQVSRPYPNGVITIQGFDSMPSYDSSWKKSLTNINGAAVTIYYKTNAQDGPSIVYIFQSSPGGKYVEVLFRSSKEDTIYNTFKEIISTFKFTN